MEPRPVLSRASVACLGVVAAFLIGGVAQAVVWRWGIDWLTAVSNSQFVWLLLCFLVGWGWSRASLAAGAAAGAATGLALIASYYVVQWLADSRDAALSQLTLSGGPAWVAAAVVGGAGIGVLGAMAGASAVSQPRRKAFGLVTVALLLAGGPVLWLVVRRDYLPAAGRWAAAALFLCLGGALVGHALRTCGVPDTLRALGGALLLAAALLGALFVLQNGLLYPTF